LAGERPIPFLTLLGRILQVQVDLARGRFRLDARTPKHYERGCDTEQLSTHVRFSLVLMNSPGGFP
jgi:hypothetical protein